ncbi:MAG: tRNA lysidine(34) synthetase TilS, partial [Clostridiales bacterium]
MKKGKKPLFKLFQEFIEEKKLLTAGDRILLAVSGGGDSMALLFLFYQLSQKWEIQLAVAYFDHQLRPESSAEGDKVEEFVQNLQIPFFRGQEDIAALAEGENLENIARRMRYRFLRKTAKAWGANKIATGHHEDDQGETVLLHLLRGSGSEGLAAIAPCEEDLIRPLLRFRKEELLLFCEENGLPYSTDESNFAPCYRRNLLRLQIIPELEKINPHLIEGLSALADILHEENQLLQMATVGALEDARLPSEGLRGKVLASLPKALQRRVLRLAYQEYAMPRGLFTGSLSYGHTESVLALKEGAKTNLPQGLWACRRQGDILFSREDLLPGKSDLIIYPRLGGPYEMGDWPWQYELKIVQVDPDQQFALDEFAFLLPLEALGHLSCRNRKSGDKILVFGMKGSKKVKDLFIDKKIPVFARITWPVLLFDENIVWIP